MGGWRVGALAADPSISSYSGPCSSPVSCWVGQAGVLASCLAPGLDWQLELDLAGAHLYICLGFTLGWKLQTEVWKCQEMRQLCVQCMGSENGVAA